jgi:hypothetical protein
LDPFDFPLFNYTIASQKYLIPLLEKLMKSLSLILVLFVFLAASATAGVPDKFTNLKILPKDIGKRELISVMQEFSEALGANCTDCHEMKTPGDYNSIDWASEKMPHKEIARGMMKMTQEVNAKLLPAATGKHDFQVRCVTCHRGVEVPRLLDEILLRTIARKGGEAGEAKYRELRSIYYGSGSYDFTPNTLMSVAQSLAQGKQGTANARRMMLLNLEMNPQHADSYLMLAQLDMTDGDNNAALVNVNKALEIDPDSRQGKRMLQQLGQ